MPAEEVADESGDLLAVRLQGEVPGVQEVDLGVRQVTGEGLRTGRPEDLVAAPQAASSGGRWVRKYSWKAG
ncbi:hypothetical protein STANM309S_00919 [Streptomyces tanashiensis]